MYSKQTHMKALLFIAALGICSLGFAQQDVDTMYAIVNGNQVSIHQDNAGHNCAFTPIPDNVAVNGNVINWYLVDTIGMIAVCECYFNYAVDIDSLSPGDYTVNLYSAIHSPYTPDSVYEGSAQFTIAGPYQCDNSFQLSSYVGPCHEYNGIMQHGTDQYSIRQYPGGLMIVSNGAATINRVVMSNLSGQEVLKNDYNAASEIYLSAEACEKGFYIIKVYDSSGIRMKRKVVIF
jgi:hypothetical protein